MHPSAWTPYLLPRQIRGGLGFDAKSALLGTLLFLLLIICVFDHV